MAYGGLSRRGPMLKIAGMFWKLPALGKISRIGMVPPQPEADRHGLAVALIVKDEARHIGEWAAFHLRAGVRRFLIYDNGGRDATMAILREVLPEAARTIVPWRQVLSDAWLGREIHNQVLAYAHAASNFGGAFRWMAFIDADEFLVPKRAETLDAALAHLGEARNLSLPWHMFGRSGHQSPPEGGVLRNYLRRARDPMSEVRGVRAFKCVVDPCHLTAVRVHSMETDGSARHGQRPRRGGGREDAGAAGVLFGGPPAAQPLLHALGGGAGGEDRAGAEPGGEVAGVCAQGAPHGGEHRGRRGRGPGGARLSGADRLGGPMRTELIVSTYNSPRALTLCLTSVARQTVLPDGICIADDGSGPETKAAVEAFAAAHPELPVRHVWHEDRGFEKAAILNRAIATSEAEFLIFIDGDVLIDPGFIARHLELARPGRFSTGSLIRLDAAATAMVTEALIESGAVFDRGWLKAHGAIDRFGTWLKTMPFPRPVMALLDRATPVQRALCGANASLFRADALKVNGFDETIKYGGGDKEFGVRLENAGVRGQHLRYTAPLVHLDHPRGYRDAEKIRRHKAMIAEVRRRKAVWTEHGIVPGAAA